MRPRLLLLAGALALGTLPLVLASTPAYAHTQVCSGVFYLDFSARVPPLPGSTTPMGLAFSSSVVSVCTGTGMHGTGTLNPGASCFGGMSGNGTMNGHAFTFVAVGGMFIARSNNFNAFLAAHPDPITSDGCTPTGPGVRRYMLTGVAYES